jgi:hypothetical protein
MKTAVLDLVEKVKTENRKERDANKGKEEKYKFHAAQPTWSLIASSCFASILFSLSNAKCSWFFT